MFEGRDNGNGFHITFENGWTVSVQWDRGNYCERSSRYSDEYAPNAPSKNAEVSAWKGQGKSDNSKGWQTPAEVLAYMAEVAAR